MQQTVSVQTARLIAAALAQRTGTPFPKMLQRLGLDPAHVMQPDATTAKSKMDSVWVRALELSGDDGFGLSLAAALAPGTLGALEYLFRNMPTLGEAYDQVVRFQNLLQQNASVWTVENSPSHRSFRFTLLPPVAAVHRHIVEFAFAGFLALGRQAASRPVHATKVTFQHARALPDARYVEVLGVAPSFEQPNNEIQFTLETCASPVVGAEPRLAEIVGFYARHQHEKLESDRLVDTTRRAIMLAMSRGDVSATAVAQSLGMSERTLRRRLSDDGVGYQAVLDDVRFETAKSYVGQPSLSVAEIALLLGFSDARAFARAFKRWSGTTVSGFRKSQSSR
ncbi:MAG: AraC family transcriptional regulator ligand-binding domain-containing protein [Nannocystales bacterium]